MIPSLDSVSWSIRTADGVVIAGEPEAASAWFPVNDHPTDRVDNRITVLNAYQVANGPSPMDAAGELDDPRLAARKTRWRATSQRSTSANG